ncbi:MAG: hypothetical protein ACNI27_03550 [Desulfovibrio sp.]
MGKNHTNNTKSLHHDNSFADYLAAIDAYQQSRSKKHEIMNQSHEPSVENCFDRFDQQHSHCESDLEGARCQACSQGPCKISEASPYGTCGDTVNDIAVRQLVRAAAGGVAAQGTMTREIALAFKVIAERANAELQNGSEQEANHCSFFSTEVINNFAYAMNISTRNKSVEELAEEVAAALLDDINRLSPNPNNTKTPNNALNAVASPERKMVWERLNIQPVGAYYEVFEALQSTSMGGKENWRQKMEHLFRLSIAFSMNSVAATSIAETCIHGLGERTGVKANLPALKTYTINIAVHGYAPELIKELIEAANNEEFTKRYQEVGAAGVQFYGLSNSNLTSLYENFGIIPLSNINGAEFVISTGALDLWLVDPREVRSGPLNTAHCYKTTVTTTNEQNLLPSVEHLCSRTALSGRNQLPNIAEKLLSRAVESYQNRTDIKRRIPSAPLEAEVGFSLSTLDKHYGCLERVSSALIGGKIKGIVNISGCINTRIGFEKSMVDIVETLLKNNILIFTNGCAALPLAKRGYLSPAGKKVCGPDLKEFLDPKMPPVWHFGECFNNTQAIATFREIAKYSGRAIRDLPFATLTPEWFNEKGLASAMASHMLGFDGYQFVDAPISGAKEVLDYLHTGMKKTIGSVLKVEPTPQKMAEMIIADFEKTRSYICWR